MMFENCCAYNGDIYTDLYGFNVNQFNQSLSELSASYEYLDNFFCDYTPFWGEKDYITTMLELQAREAGYNSLADVAEDKVDELYNEDIIQVRYFEQDSRLCYALLQWFDCTVEELASHLRSGYYNKQSHTFFFVTGIGYDTISSDLLGREPDGVARKQFGKQFSE